MPAVASRLVQYQYQRLGKGKRRKKVTGEREIERERERWNKNGNEGMEHTLATGKFFTFPMLVEASENEESLELLQISDG